MTTIMTVSDLIAELEKFDGSLPVEIATQQSWPLAHGIQAVKEATNDDGDTAVYIAGKEPHDYAPDGVY